LGDAGPNPLKCGADDHVETRRLLADRIRPTMSPTKIICPIESSGGSDWVKLGCDWARLCT